MIQKKFCVKNLDFLESKEAEEIQKELLIQHCQYTFKNSPFYKKKIKNKKINKANILQIFKELPFTEKEDLEKKNSQFFACSANDIVDICLSSATTSKKATTISLTYNDILRLSYNEKMALGTAGINKYNKVLIATAIDKCFMAGLAYFLGGLGLEATIIRAGASSSSHIVKLLKQFQPDAIIGVPSFMKKIADSIIAESSKPEIFGVKKLIAIGEPTKDKNLNLLPMSKKLQELWNAEIFSTYASSEVASTFCECEKRLGGHLRRELVYLEIVDEKGNICREGEIGEVVLTPMGVTGTPLIRFKTGDISFIIKEQCLCGRTSPRLGPIIGRKKQMLKYKGTTLFPNSILANLEDKSYFEGGYVEARQNSDGTDRVLLYVAIKEENQNLLRLKEDLKASIRVLPEIKMISKDEAFKKMFLKNKRKRTIFYDLRN